MIPHARDEPNERGDVHGRKHAHLGPAQMSRALLGNMLFDDEMRVHTTRANRGQARAARQFTTIRTMHARPGFERALDIERRRCERDVWIERLGMQRRHKLPVLHLQENLRHPRQRGSREKMRDIRFYRADRAELGVGGVRAVRLRQRPDFDRIAKRRA